MNLNDTDLKSFLEEKTNQYNNPSFIATDPVAIPHLFEKKEDIEIAGFLAATIAWGQRPTIIRNARKLMELMNDDPHEFIINCREKDLLRFRNFKHRTFNGEDCTFFIRSLQNIYRNHGGLEKAMTMRLAADSMNAKKALTHFRKLFFGISHPDRTLKHVSDPSKGSSAKRLNMFLRWMVRKDNKGVDFGLWKGIGMRQLSIPLDVHTGTIARKLGLLKRTQNDWKAVNELDSALRKFDPDDPVKYDFALFGLGAFENF